LATSGSLPEWQEFSSRVAKPPCCFRDRALTPLMAADGWIVEWRLFGRTGSLYARWNVGWKVSTPPVRVQRTYPARRGRGELLCSSGDPRYDRMTQIKQSPENRGASLCFE
jgi:hypothetical protein